MPPDESRKVAELCENRWFSLPSVPISAKSLPHRHTNLKILPHRPKNFTRIQPILLSPFKRHPHQCRVSLLPNRLWKQTSTEQAAKEKFGVIFKRTHVTSPIFSCESSGKLPVRVCPEKGLHLASEIAACAFTLPRRCWGVAAMGAGAEIVYTSLARVA